MAQEIGVHGIRINTLSPGVSLTTLLAFLEFHTDIVILVHPHGNDRRSTSS
jgi:NAD(P)-dependent dehydrogenase (short-subunit alcohol dehydrogenase family)